MSCADAVDPWNPKCVRAAAGSLFRVPWVEAGTVDDCVALLRGAGMRLIACDAGGPVGYEDADLRGDVAVLVGNEAHGLLDGAGAAADMVVSIPMAGAVESLNVAMTGTVLAFESARQRRAGGAGSTDRTEHRRPARHRAGARPDGALVAANRAATALLGDTAAAVGEPFAEHFDTRDPVGEPV